MSMTTYTPLPFSQIKYLADNESKGIDKLVEETGLPRERVIHEIEKLKQQRYEEAKQSVVPAKKETEGVPPEETPLLKAIPRKSGVTVMTGAASQLGDEIVGSKRRARDVPQEDITTVRR